MAQQLLLLLPAPSRTFSQPLPSPSPSPLPRRHLSSISATRGIAAGVAAARRDLLLRGMRRSVAELELAKHKQRQGSRANGIFWILLLNFSLYVANHLLQIRHVQALYLYHAFPAWYQFVTSTFCHANSLVLLAIPDCVPFSFHLVMEAAGASPVTGHSLQVNNIAHLSGALIGAALVFPINRLPLPSNGDSPKTPKG